jgi:putative phosphoesterase
MKSILLLSDTHGYLDPKIEKYILQADEIWHAGDIGSVELADQISAQKPLRAVYGNIDDAKLRRMFPLNQVFECEGLKVCMTHIGGYPGKYPERIRKMIESEKPGLFICGHSHILKVMYDKHYQLVHMNPGAAGKHGFHQKKTLIRFSIAEGKIISPEVIEIGNRVSV